MRTPLLVVYLFITLFCSMFVSTTEEEPTSVDVCERNSHKISCQGNQMIEITAADYGRSSKQTCPSLFALNTNCHSPSALGITKKECDGFKECTLYANNEDYGDPCFGTFKYLTVSYKCTKTKPNRVFLKARVCEGNKQSIECSGKRKIDVEYANYGRLKGGHVCGKIFLTKNCKAADSLSKVKEDCQGKTSCTLEANNGKFGDPCWGTQKYLEVDYRCR